MIIPPDNLNNANKNGLLTTLLFVITALCCSMQICNAQQTPAYPRVAGYFSVIEPIGTWNKDGFTSNFSGAYTIGFPFGLNLLKSDKFGISFEVAPSIRTEKNVSKVSSVLFHPGAMFRFQRGFTFIGRMAFETNGRFGFTPVFNQRIIKGKDAAMFLSVPIPVRFGNGVPTSIGTGLQVGVSF
ncbi:hypothetical protein [Mucilaginibacter psychrotolerans]|uniref:Outer membrane protein beta-barrel domain-containing protein n=1 Tax=Mucilaginibacter psychrotolerans TaxID=1524096 RepID=A0A4Y8S876_9SPHI|nr:hypothetical protein [Mucilaginibacter psychrotolerans]TFF35092.1 hypothetical protein E2R66_20330 [Mucilaginibacter psychrotolerans]